jgi:hypothetical protein
VTGGWRFAEAPDLGVYATRQVIEGGEPLGLISHDLDGDWQFLHNEDAEEDGELRDVGDLMFVHLHHVTSLFPEVHDVADLPLGWIAWRDGPDDPWVREPRPAHWATDET